ncbi:hypothetical protein HYU17_01955 [Candidatus Woesearchaeota archaeon]|nr:hypothetical protein [Candidatus Woesearchaeota archaeon]
MEPGNPKKKNDLVAWAHSKVPGLENLASFIRFLIERRLIALFMLAALVLLFFFWNYIKVIIVMVFFIAIGTVSMLYNRWIKVSLGVELIMVGLVVTSVSFGRLPGLVVGLVGLFLAEVLSERFTYSTFVSFIGIAVVGLAAPNIFHQADSITSTGIIMTIIYDAIIAPGYILLGSNAGRTALFIVTHIIFNIWAFSFIAPAVYGIVQLL